MKKGKRGKRLLALSSVLVLLMGGTAGLSAYNAAQEKKAAQEDTAETTEIIAFSIAENAIAGIATRYGETALSIVRRDGAWQLEDEPDFPLLQSRVGNMASTLTQIVATGTVEGKDIAEYGLDTPICTVTVMSELGDTSVLEIGDKNPVTGDYYLRVDGGDTLYTFSSTKAGYFLKEKMDLIEEEDFPTIDSGDITRVALSNGHTLIKDAEGFFTDEAGNKANAAKMSDYLESLTGIGTIEYLDDRVDEDEMNQYGFDEPVLTIEITYALESEATLDAKTQALAEGMRRFSRLERIPGLLDRIRIEEAQTPQQRMAASIAARWGGVDDGEKEYTLTSERTLTLVIGKQLEGGDYTFTHSQTTRAMTISQETFEAIQACAYTDLRSDYVCDLLMSDVVKLSVRAGGVEKTVEKKTVFDAQEDGTYDSRTAYFLGDTEVGSAKYRTLFNALTTLSAQAYLAEPTVEEATAQEAAQAGLTAVFTLARDETHTLTLTTYDGSFYLACYDGVAEKLISKRDVESALAAFEALNVEQTE